MNLDEIPSITSLLEGIKNRSQSCLKNSDVSQALIGKINDNMKDYSPSNHNGEHENRNKIGEDLGGRVHEELDYLENILLEKMQENSKLKALNERLLRSSREKSHKIKELSRTVSQHDQRNPMTKDVSVLKDKIGECNVEIQKLKKQFYIETKKLHNEKAKAARLRKKDASLDTPRKSPEVVKKSSSVEKVTKHFQETDQETKSFKDLDEIFIQKTHVLIKHSEETNINDETFDELENLDSDTDEECDTDETCIECPNKMLKESTDADNEILP